MTTTSIRPENGDSTADPEPPGSSRLVLAVASGATFLAVLDTTVVNVAFPSLRSDFSTEPLAHLTWVITAYAVVFASLLAVAGRVADILGRRRLFLVSTTLFTCASLFSGISPSLPLLVASRTLQGIAAAGMIPAALGLVLAHTVPARRAAAIGVWGAVSSMAAAVGPSLGGLLVDAWGWRSVFLINLPLGILFVTLAVRGISADAPSGRRMPDPVGVVSLALGMSGLVFGVTQGSTWGWGSGRVIGLLAGGAVLTVLALVLSRRHSSPAIELDLWQNRSFAGTNLTSLLFGASLYAYLLSTLLYLNAVWGYSELKSGLAVTPGAFSAALGAMIVGRVAPARQWLAVLTGSVVFGVSCVLMYQTMGSHRHYLELWLPIGIPAGIGIGAALTGLSTAAARSLPPERFASGTGLLMTARQAGGALGIAALAAILQHSGVIGDKGYVQAFLACGLCALAAAVSAVLIRHRAAD